MEATDQPPHISKPGSKNGTINKDLIRRQLEVPYYQSATDNWDEIKFDTLLDVLKVLCEEAMTRSKKHLVISWRFQGHPKAVIDEIYSQYRENVFTYEEAPENFRRVLRDVFQSTEEGKWLFSFLSGQVWDKWRRRARKSDGKASVTGTKTSMKGSETSMKGSEASTKSTKPSTEVGKSRTIGVKDLVNEHNRNNSVVPSCIYDYDPTALPSGHSDSSRYL
ncbi:hypothetical protein TWF281_007858 [Arthrobotrys megalospora]